MALPVVSRVMFSASRIGTPLATSVPSVRVVRARMFFSMRLPKIGTLMMNWSQPMRPCLELADQLDREPDRDRDAGDQVPVVDAPLGDRRPAAAVIGGSSRSNSSKILLERGHDLDHDERQDADGHRDDDDRVDHRAFDFALERFGPFLEVGQALQNELQRTARLAGLDHVHVQPVEALGALGHAFGERGAGFDFVAGVFERVLEPARLGLAGENPQAAQNRQAGVLQNRKLPRERGQVAAT